MLAGAKCHCGTLWIQFPHPVPDGSQAAMPSNPFSPQGELACVPRTGSSVSERKMTGTCLKFAGDLLHRFALLVPSPCSAWSLLTLLATPSTSTSTYAQPVSPPQAPLEPPSRHHVLAVTGVAHPDHAVLPTLQTVVQQVACCQLVGPVATLELGKLKFDPIAHHGDLR